MSEGIFFKTPFTEEVLGIFLYECRICTKIEPATLENIENNFFFAKTIASVCGVLKKYVHIYVKSNKYVITNSVHLQSEYLNSKKKDGQQYEVWHEFINSSGTTTVTSKNLDLYMKNLQNNCIKNRFFYKFSWVFGKKI